jgi:hypothetical protein
MECVYSILSNRLAISSARCQVQRRADQHINGNDCIVDSGQYNFGSSAVGESCGKVYGEARLEE